MVRELHGHLTIASDRKGARFLLDLPNPPRAERILTGITRVAADPCEHCTAARRQNAELTEAEIGH
jgi:hypothetical protein